jgi:hypothetical protein
MSAVWPIIDTLLQLAEGNPQLREHPNEQAELVYQLGNPDSGYWHLSPAKHTEVVSRIIELVPRVGTSREPKVTLESLFRLWHGPEPYESIARAVRVEPIEPSPWADGDKVYQTGGWLDLFMEWAGDNSDCPKPYLWWGGLAALASVCGWRYYVDRNADKLRLGTLYAILVGPKGSLKSVGLDACREVLWHVNHQVHPWVPGSSLPDTTTPCPFAVRFLPEDTNWRTIIGCLKSELFPMAPWLTPEELDRDVRGMLDVNGNYRCTEHGVLLLDELGVLFGRENFAVERLIPGLNAIHGGRPFVYQTQSGGKIILERPSLTWVGCCPPDIMRDAVTPTLIKGGMMDRTMVVYRPRNVRLRHSTPAPRDPVRAAVLAHHLLKFARSLRPTEMIGTADAKDWFDRWFHATPALGEDETSKPRLSNHLWRTAAYISLAKGNTPWIHTEDLRAALAILERETQGFRELTRVLEEDEAMMLQSYIERVLLDRGAVEGEGWVWRRDLLQRLRSKKGLTTVQRVEPLLESLLAAGRVNKQDGGGPNRMGQAWQLTAQAAADLRKRA